MSFLDEVRAKRQKLADVLSDEDYSGIREIVEELYPDRAHFIFELLQNAEDTGATEASFALGENSVSFEHNGRSFSKEDVWGITNIGKGTKKDQEDQIGRFGVGFKAVFAYSETPHIWSPTFSFKISELVLPTVIPTKPDIGQKTRIELRFNNPKKRLQDAYAEVKAGLEELAETTLLFLSHLKSIRWQIGQRGADEVLRYQHSENHVEVLKRAGGKTASSSHFLRFSGSVVGLEKQRVSVAYALDRLPNVDVFDRKKALAKQLKIIPANPGRVAVFFPAEKETSGLRFHLHAPFVPELSRASIKETPTNDPLFKQLAELASASLHRIRDMNLLTADFLGVLPNQQDTIPARYESIRKSIIDEMNNKPLTPTHSKSHAPAKHLLQAKALLKDLLSAEDIEFMVDYNEEPPQWAIGAAQKNSNADRFLDGLAIRQWDIEQFVKLLEEKTTESHRQKPDDKFMAWLARKPVEWHQQFYGLLFEPLASTGWRKKQIADKMNSLQIVRLNDGTYSVGSKCFFPSDGVEHDEILPRVAKGVYSSGKSKTKQEEAKKLLEEIGVRQVGEAELVEAILNKRYTEKAKVPDKTTYKKDLERFISLVEKEPRYAELFAKYWIFERKDGKWGKPSQVFLDKPLLDTGLSAFYDALGEDAERAALAESYQDCGVAREKLVKFAEQVGVQTSLEIHNAKCLENKEWSSSLNSRGNRTAQGTDQDFTINGLAGLLGTPNESLSRLVWKTASEQKKNDWMTARYCNNASQEPRKAPSQLIALLRDFSWVPQAGGRFVRPAEASSDLLPEGFPFDPGWRWIKAIRFGEDLARQSQEHQQTQAVAKALGFTDNASLERAKRFTALPPDQQERILADWEQGRDQNLPDHEPANPALRAKRVGDQAADARERCTEERTRSVSIGREEVKQEAAQYLRQQYTNTDGEMICQVCKRPLPFKLDDGSDYFEKVEFLPDMRKRHYQNYLALCPNHAAMFQHANGSAEVMRGRFVEIPVNVLDVVLARMNATIYFTKTHIIDLRKVIEVDQATPEGPPGE